MLPALYFSQKIKSMGLEMVTVVVSTTEEDRRSHGHFHHQVLQSAIYNFILKHF